MKSNSKNTFIPIIIITIITLVTKLLGVFRDIYLANCFGASNITDAYFIALAVPNTIFSFIGSGIATSFIYVYTSITKKYNKKKAIIFTNNIIMLVILFCLTSVLIYLFAPNAFISVFASGFDKETINITRSFLNLGIFSILFISIGSIISAYLEINEKYNYNYLYALLTNFLYIIFIYLAFNKNIKYLGNGIFLSNLISFVILLPYIKNSGFKICISNPFKDEFVRELMVISLPVIIGVAVNDINGIIDKTLASRISTGGVTVLQYAQTIVLLIQGIFVMPLLSVIYPKLTLTLSNREYDSANSILNKSIVGVAVLLVPILVGTVINAKEIISVTYGRGIFSNDEVLVTAYVLIGYSLSIIGRGFRQVYTRALFAIKDMKTPMYNGMLGVALNILFSIILSKHFGLAGISFATSFASIIISILLYHKAKKTFPKFEDSKSITSILKIILCSIIMGVIVYFVRLNLHNTNINSSMQLAIVIASGGAVYFILIYFARIHYLDEFCKDIFIKIKGKYINY